MSGATDLVVRILLEDDGLDQGLKSAEQKIKGFSPDTAATMAAAGSVAVLGGMAYVGAQAVDSLKNIEVINAQTASVIASTGGAAGVTAAYVEDLSGRLEGLTATEGESIQQGANMLLTFTNIKNQVGEGNDIFDQATSVLVDYARAMGTEPASAAIQLGKALNDPIAGISALGRAGVQFTDEQKALIESLVESGDVMGAQKIILGELNTQFGGSGASYAETMAGKQDLFNHKIGELTEKITVGLLPSIEGFLDTAVGFATWASENSELVGGLATVVGVLAGAVLIASAAYKGLAFLQGISTLFGVMRGATVVGTAATAANTAAVTANNVAWYASPVTWIILAIIAAIAGLVAAGIWLVSNWDGVVKFFGEAWTNISNGAGAAFGWIGEQAKGFIDGFLSIPQRIGDAFSGLGDMLRTVAHTVASAIAWLWNNSVGKIAFDVPGWVPFIGGQRFAVPQIVVPALAAGGIVTSATLALIGEAGPEAVVPLPQWDAMRSRAASPTSVAASGDSDVIVHSVLTLDGRTVYEATERHKRKRR